MHHDQRVALVTGAGHGIGRAIALRLAQAGFAVGVHYWRSTAAARDVVKEINQLGGRAAAMQGDISLINDIQGLFSRIDEDFGRLDVLVNNAGVVQASPLESLSEEVFDKMFATNVKGPSFAAKEAAQRMKHGGRIVNITSSRVHFPASSTTAYAGSKAALEMLTAVWAQELGAKGITVNAVAPGPTSPGMIDRAPEFMKTAAIQSSPFLRIGTADEIAGVVAFLCSEDARWITGQVFLANGGGKI